MPSLMNRGGEVVTVFAEVVATDRDGNTVTKPSTVGVVTRAVVQPLSSTVSSGDHESQKAGFETTSKYRLRLVNWKGQPLGAQSAVEWQGRRYGIDGEPRIFTSGSPRMRHTDYVIVRS